MNRPLRFTSLLVLLFLLSCQSTPTAPEPPESPAEDAFSSNLPIVTVQSEERIRDEPKVQATLQILSGAERNTLDDEPSDYDGPIGIEIRGQTSQSYPKKQYGLETRDASGDNNNVSLLGLPEENDWVLQGPYSDKSLMRNALAYDLSRSMGHYASRTVFTEMFLNGEYQGLYILMEKIKRDKNRVDISKQDEDDLTGGYLLELTGSERLGEDEAFFRLPEKNRVIAHVYPDGDDLDQAAATYIKDYMTAFETALYSETFRDPETGYAQYLDVDAAIDYMLVQEVFKNVDAFNASTFLYKDKGERLTFGPVWDFNLSSGNHYLEPLRQTEGWLLTERIWVERLLQDPAFVERYVARWQELEQSGVFANLISKVDEYAATLAEAQERNFEQWPILGEVVWPNPPEYTFMTYEEEVAYLRDWLQARVTWLDENIPLLLETSG